MKSIKRISGVVTLVFMLICLSISAMAAPGVIMGDKIKDGTYEIDVESSSPMFKITKCELTVKDGQMKARMTLSGKGYEKLYMGTGENAQNAPDSDFYYYEENADGSYSYTVPIDRLNEGVYCAAFSIKKQKWYDRTLTFNSERLPLGAVKKTYDIAGITQKAGLVVFILAVCAIAIFLIIKIKKK